MNCGSNKLFVFWSKVAPIEVEENLTVMVTMSVRPWSAVLLDSIQSMAGSQEKPDKTWVVNSF